MNRFIIKTEQFNYQVCLNSFTVYNIHCTYIFTVSDHWPHASKFCFLYPFLPLMLLLYFQNRRLSKKLSVLNEDDAYVDGEPIVKGSKYLQKANFSRESRYKY